MTAKNDRGSAIMDKDPVIASGTSTQLLAKTRLPQGKILVVGGYGGVGRTVSATLGERFPGRVVVAGRSMQKAQDFVRGSDNRLVPLKLDVSLVDEIGAALDDGVSMAVMCVEQKDTRFVEQCIERGIHYVDISATDELLTQIESLNSKAREHGSTVLLSAGLAPGVTNLLVSQAAAELDEVENVDIFILLGLGEVHGESSNRWVLDNLNSEYTVRQSGMNKTVKAFGEFKKTVFPGDAGKRSAFRFDFSDQHTVARTLGIDSASTWMCFDSAALTWFLYVEKKLGLLSLLRFPIVKRMYLKLFGSIHVGSEVFILQVVANGIREGKPSTYTCSVSGQGEAHATGLVATQVAEHLYTSNTPSGVFHIEQIFDQPKEFIANLSTRVPALEYRF